MVANRFNFITGCIGVNGKYKLYYIIFDIQIIHQSDSVAQPVEQLTLNQWVESSSLSRVTISGIA
jgi:hypothetical protein